MSRRTFLQSTAADSHATALHAQEKKAARRVMEAFHELIAQASAYPVPRPHS